MRKLAAVLSLRTLERGWARGPRNLGSCKNEANEVKEVPAEAFADFIRETMKGKWRRL